MYDITFSSKLIDSLLHITCIFYDKDIFLNIILYNIFRYLVYKSNLSLTSMDKHMPINVVFLRESLLTHATDEDLLIGRLPALAGVECASWISIPLPAGLGPRGRSVERVNRCCVARRLPAYRTATGTEQS